MNSPFSEAELRDVAWTRHLVEQARRDDRPDEALRAIDLLYTRRGRIPQDLIDMRNSAMRHIASVHDAASQSRNVSMRVDTEVVWGILGFIGILALVIYLVVAWFNRDEGDNEYGLQSTAWSACKQSVENQLKAPATAEFPSMSSATFSGSKDEWTISSYVDAENSFGAQLRNDFTCTATWNESDQTYTAIAMLY